MLRSWWRRGLTILFLFVIVACSGGGCGSGCSACGMTPLAGGFPNASAITNSGSARVTRPGLDFIAANAPALAQKLIGGAAGVYKYPISKSSGSASGFSYTICPNGPNPTATPLEQCTVDIEIGMAKFHVDAAYQDTNTSGDNSIILTGTLPVRLQELPVSISGLTINVGLGSPSGSCNGNDPAIDYVALPVDVEIPLINGTSDPRNGYTTIDVKNMKVNLGLTSGDLSLCGCGALSIICDPIFNFLGGLLFSTLQSSLQSQITSVLNSQLCTKPDPTLDPPCPTGSQPSSGGDAGADGGASASGTCVYTADTSTCVPIQLGTDGHLNLGTFLANVSPGTTGGLDILLSAGGAMDPAPDSPADNTPYTGHTPNGITLGLLGGALPSPQSTCVPAMQLQVPTGIPIPDELKLDKQTPWPATDPTGPDIGIALSGRFLDFALGGVYNSGLLCLGVSTDYTQQLNSGLLSVLIKSIKYLTWEQKPAAAAVVTRPQALPTVKIGGGTDVNKDPLIAVQLNQFAVDFYIWSDDRFIRAFTFTADLTVPVNLSTAVDPTKNPNGGVLPVIGDLVANNATVTNNALLLETPDSIANALAAILGGITGQLTGSLKAFNVSSALASLGLALTIPDGGIRKLSKGTDDFIAIFGDLALPGSMGMMMKRPKVDLTGLVIHPDAMTMSTFDRAKLPELSVHLSSPDDDGTHPVEYAYWIDQGTRSEWTSQRDITIQDSYLFFQGKHTLYVTSRFADQAGSQPVEAGELPFLIDVIPPYVAISATDTGAKITSWDLVTDNTALVARTQTTDAKGTVGAWTAWAPLASVQSLAVSGAANVAVEVKDEAGNVGSATVALIRGRPDSTLTAAASSCGCSTPGASDSGSSWWGLALGLGIVALGARRGSLRRLASVRFSFRSATALGMGASLAVVAGLSQGCSCGSGNHASGPSTTGCGSDCNQPCEPALPMGLIGAYTSIARATDGTTWVAGYNDSAVTSDFSGLYGDLVVGKYDMTKQAVAWQSVDGLPAPLAAGTCPDYDPTGWRHGQSDPGTDVGLWTSLQLDGKGNPMVSYYDATNEGLKFASYDGTNWSSHTVLQTMGSDIGRYSKMVLVGGNPVIAFLVMEPGDMGKIRSKVRVATATVAIPKAGTDWTFEDAAVDDNGPCRAAFCTGTDVCVSETNSCMTPSTGCTPADCGGSPSVCVTVAGKPTCQTSVSSSFIDIYPNAYADYVAMAVGPNGLGIVVYDRLHGNLVGVSKTSGAWTTTVLDGETGSRAPNSGPDGGISAVDTGDVGVGADLFIAPNGDWNISYVNGSLETLQYILVPGGGMPTNKPEVVDDGTKLDGMAFADGLHIVGDDSFLAVDANGNVTISYQDATAGTLRVASGAPSTGATHVWKFTALSQPNRFAGFFSHFIPGDTQIANWWRASDPTSGSISGDVAFVASQ